MAKTITVEELKANPLSAMHGSDGEPVAVMNGEYLLYYLANGSDLNVKRELSLREAARLVGTSKSSIKRRIAKKELDGRQKKNGDYAIDPNELRKVFADN